MKTLRECIKEAEGGKRAIGHFNVSNLSMIHGVYQAAKNVSASAGRSIPAIIGLSEGEEVFFGREEAVAVIRAIRSRDDYPIFLNADHHFSLEKIKLDIDAGFDSIVFDGAKLGFEENVRLTEECVDYARKVTKETGRDILIEAELGYIGTGSDIKNGVPEGAGIKTLPEDGKRFVGETGIDLFAPSVGNLHGIVKGYEPVIDADLVSEIRKATGVSLVLHGGSGIPDDGIGQAIQAGISVVHVSTELRVAYAGALRKTINGNPEEITPYKLLEPSQEAVQAVVEKKLKLFNNIQ